jgi:hypothetical protein
MKEIDGKTDDILKKLDELQSGGGKNKKTRKFRLRKRNKSHKKK